MDNLVWIFFSALVINNFTLYYFLGLCPFFGVTSKLETAFRLGLANIFVMIITAICAWFLKTYILVYAPYLQVITFIVVIASTVQFVEMVIKKLSPAALPGPGNLSAAHHHQLCHSGPCALLDQSRLRFRARTRLRSRRRRRPDAGPGLMAGLREEAELSNIPSVIKGTAMNLIIAGILSLAFMGFAGLFSA